MTIRQTKSRVFAFDLATGNPVTGGAAAITAKWAKDYGTPTALTDTNPVEAEDGFYHFDLSIAERDAEIIGEIYPESSTSGVQVIGVPAFFLAQTASGTTGGASTCSPEISLSDEGSRRITWPTADESITGTIQWRGQAAKAITGLIEFAETIDGVHFYDWAYAAADRPSEASWGIIVLTDGTVTDDPLVVGFVDGVSGILDAVDAIAAQDPVFVQSAITDPTIVELVANDTYDGVGKPKLTWTVTKDYTDAWDVVFTIRDKDDVVVATAAGVVASTTSIEVTLTAPSAGLTFEGCPAIWQGRFDLELSKNDSVETIALGDVYIYRDVSR